MKYTNEYIMRKEKNSDCIMTETLFLNQPSCPKVIKVYNYYNVRKYWGFCFVKDYGECYNLKEIVEECENI